MAECSFLMNKLDLLLNGGCNGISVTNLFSSLFINSQPIGYARKERKEELTRCAVCRG